MVPASRGMVCSVYTRRRYGRTLPSGSFATSLADRAHRSEPWRDALRICAPAGNPAARYSLLSQRSFFFFFEMASERTRDDGLVDFDLLAEIVFHFGRRDGHEVHDGRIGSFGLDWTGLGWMDWAVWRAGVLLLGGYRTRPRESVYEAVDGDGLPSRMYISGVRVATANGGGKSIRQGRQAGRSRGIERP